MTAKERYMVFPTSIPSPDVQFLQIGPLRIYFYALCILTGIVLAAIWAGSRLSKRGGERGAVIDFTEEIIGARFVIQNPNASSSCGCGTSFSV